MRFDNRYQKWDRPPVKLRELGTVVVIEDAARAIERMGIAVECVVEQHQRGVWGSALGPVEAFNARRDESDLGGWLSTWQISRTEYLLIVTGVTLTPATRYTCITLLTLIEPPVGGEG